MSQARGGPGHHLAWHQRDQEDICLWGNGSHIPILRSEEANVSEDGIHGKKMTQSWQWFIHSWEREQGWAATSNRSKSFVGRKILIKTEESKRASIQHGDGLKLSVLLREDEKQWLSALLGVRRSPGDALFVKMGYPNGKKLGLLSQSAFLNPLLLPAGSAKPDAHLHFHYAGRPRAAALFDTAGLQEALSQQHIDKSLAGKTKSHIEQK